MTKKIGYFHNKEKSFFTDNQHQTKNKITKSTYFSCILTACACAVADQRSRKIFYAILSD
jgi:hypothetical protein